MRTSNAELLAEIDMLEDIKGVDASELEVVRCIEQLENRVAMFKVSNKTLERYFSKKENANKFMSNYPASCGLRLTCIGFADVD